MKGFKIISLLMISVLFSACGDDDNSGSLRYRHSKYAKFEIYAGSPDGAILVKERMDTIRYFSPIVEDFTNATMRFEGDKVFISQLSTAEVSSYTFENGSFYIDGQYYGSGNESKLFIRQHYYAYKIDGRTIHRFKAPSQVDFTRDEALTATGLAMKNETDTLVICTRESLFQ